MIPANFNYESPNTLKEALNLLSAHDDAKILAGEIGRASCRERV